MKHLLILFISLILIKSCAGQVFFNMGAGINAGNKNVFPLLNTGAGIKKQNIVLTGEMLAPLNRQSKSFMLYGLTLGYDFNGLQPTVGIYNHFQSSDFKSQNKNILPVFGLNYVLPINDNGGLYGKVIYCDRSIIGAIGFHVNIQL